MTTNSPNLPSRVEETLALCPQFRILLVGNTGIGKSSLVSNIFDVDMKDIDIAHDRVGEADITREYTSSTNPRFILHDSKGFESGSDRTWAIVEDFIRNRCSTERPLKDRLHTIWLCLETPREGSRLLETGDQKLLKIANELRLPVVIVFTKYDLLFIAKYQDARKSGTSKDKLLTTAEKNAAADLRKRLDGFRDDNINLKFVEWVKDSRSNYQSVRWVKVSTDANASTNAQSVSWVEVSTDQKYRNPSDRLQMLKKLTEVTRRCLHEVEGDLHVSWAIAQKIHAQQKVNSSIDEGFKKYWINLGMGTIFEGQILWDCVSRIHNDILLVWNFHDPDNILSGHQFCKNMVELIQPLLQTDQPEPQSDILHTSDLASIAGNIAETFKQVLSAAGIAASVIKFLYGKYQKLPLTVLCFGAYIVDLTVILHNLFMDMLPNDPPRPVLRESVQDTLHKYKMSDAPRIHELVRDMFYGRQDLRPEEKKEKIVDLIRKELKMDPVQDHTAYGAHNGQLEVHNQRREAPTPGAETGTGQNLDSMGGSGVNTGGDHGSGVHQREQDRNAGDNDKVDGSVPNQDTDAGDQRSKHEDSKELKMDPMQNPTAYGIHNEQLEVHNRRGEASTRDGRGNQILADKSDVNMGGDHGSGVHKHHQDRIAGDNGSSHVKRKGWRSRLLGRLRF